MGKSRKTELKSIMVFILTGVSMISFLVGLKVGEEKSSKAKYNMMVEKIPTKTIEDPGDIYRRCGPMPDKIGIKRSNYTIVKGPSWSPDCRHISWSVSESGTSGIRDLGPYENEGLYLYSDKTGVTRKVIPESASDQQIIFITWKDRNTIIFNEGQKESAYILE